MRWLAAAALLVSTAAGAEGGQPLFLHEVQVVSTAAQDALWEDVTVELQMHPDSRRRPGAIVARGGAKLLEDGTIRLLSHAYQGGKDAAGPGHTASTFVIDWKDPAVAALREQLVDEGGKPLRSPQALRAFVARYIDNKGMSRAYDAASVVARARQGDCTEHAVLLAALARMQKVPARVVHGLVLLKLPRGIQAFGHAWVEIRAKAGWQVLDAALGDEGSPLYIPLAVMQDEGPAHSMRLWAQATPADVVAVRVAPKASAAPSATK